MDGNKCGCGCSLDKKKLYFITFGGK